MTYTLKYQIPEVDDYLTLRSGAGLSPKSEAAARLGLPNSLCSVMVFLGDEPVGLGRIVGDGGCFFEIVDVAVTEPHQEQGLGRRIMEALLEYLERNAPPSAYISLMADDDKPDFYAKFGFVRKEPPNGSGMFLRVT